MAYRKLTIRRMRPVTREGAKILNDLDSLRRRMKNYLTKVEDVELDARALAKGRELNMCDNKPFNPDMQLVALTPEQAMLLDAAPDLLDALIALADYVADEGVPEDCEDKYGAAIAAIDKAKAARPAPADLDFRESG